MVRCVPLSIPDDMLVDGMKARQALHTEQSLLHTKGVQHRLLLSSLYVPEHLL
jgi:hypothetical protein